MADDLLRGFLRFTDDFQFNIANERAVERATEHLMKERGFEIDAAFADPGNAVNAVQAAIGRKSPRDEISDNVPGVDGITDFTEIFDL